MVMVFFILLNYGDFLLTKIGCFRLTLFGDFLLTLTTFLFYNALFKDLVDICKNAIVILSISSVKINRHWQFNDISAYEWYLFHH